jgi:tetratricopeptide (TPR) repeat protein
VRVSRFLNGVVRACALLVAGLGTAGLAYAQSDRPPIFDYVPGAGQRAQLDAEVEALNQRVFELHQVGKYSEALAIAKQYVVAAEKRHGDEHVAYATAISWLAGLLKEANRLGEAEPLMRRALAINEKSFGYNHPNVAVCLNNLAGLLYITCHGWDQRPDPIRRRRRVRCSCRSPTDLRSRCCRSPT